MSGSLIPLSTDWIEPTFNAIGVFVCLIYFWLMFKEMS